jgi:hypothetical protein
LVDEQLLVLSLLANDTSFGFDLLELAAFLEHFPAQFQALLVELLPLLGHVYYLSSLLEFQT